MGELSPWHWAIVILIAVLLFGSRRLPEAARSLGRSARILKAELREGAGTPPPDDPPGTTPPPAAADRPAEAPRAELREAPPAPADPPRVEVHEGSTAASPPSAPPHPEER